MQTRSAAAISRVPKVDLAWRGATIRRHIPEAKVEQRVVAGQAVQSRSSSDDLSDAETAVVASKLKYSVRDAPPPQEPNGGMDLFLYKLQLAWNIFFPDEGDQSSQGEVKSRLRMVLVADRCGMSPASLSDMKASIMKALEGYIDIDCEESIDVAISSDPLNGTVYSVNIPVKRVKANVRFSEMAEMIETSQGGVTLEWSPDQWDKDPSKRFPMGC
eukprot:gene14525-20556_t